MDAGRRSTHSNAYFTGLRQSKRNVLFDTLSTANTRDEILAVLAHELGILSSSIYGSFTLPASHNARGTLRHSLDRSTGSAVLHIPDTAVPIVHRTLYHRNILVEKRIFLKPFYAGGQEDLKNRRDAFAADLQKNPSLWLPL